MKAFLFSICLVGCLKPIPPVPEPPRVIAVIEVPEPPPMVIYEEPDAGPPVQTWLTGEALQKVLEERAEQEHKCQKGDPLCSDVED
jgi:hypothetical protein